MKNVLALAIAAALMSPLALANTPDNVGNVTYLGNIVANSPMWQWTVNDYPGGRLDAKPSEATTANGLTTYPLNGQAFIAVSGYLPSLEYVTNGSNFSGMYGVSDKTGLSDAQGNVPGNITAATDGAVTFTIAAAGSDARGADVDGILKIKATEIRGGRLSYVTASNGSVIKRLGIRADTNFTPAVSGGSCFAGAGPFGSLTDVVRGTAVSPTAGTGSSSAFTAFVTAITRADDEGSAPKFETLGGGIPGTADAISSICETQSALNLQPGDTAKSNGYSAGAHILELTPVELAFNTPVQGTWNATLTVTAYQM